MGVIATKSMPYTFRKMRLKKRELPKDACLKILNDATSGVLAVSGDDGYPYAVPLSYVFDEGKIYFHSAKEGHKIDAIRKSEKASFCVAVRDDVVPNGYTTIFKSVIVFGRIAVVEDGAAKRAAIEKLALKYAPADAPENRVRAINGAWDSFLILEFVIEHVTGKSSEKSD